MSNTVQEALKNTSNMLKSIGVNPTPHSVDDVINATKKEFEQKNGILYKNIQKEYDNQINFGTLSNDIASTAQSIESALNGWQDKNTLDATKKRINDLYNRLMSYKSYMNSFGGTSFAEEDKKKLDDQINTYKAVLDNWDNATKGYGNYKSANEYNNAIKREKMTKEELLKIREEVKPLETKYTLYKNTMDNPETAGLHYSKYAKAQENLNKALKKHGIDNIEQLRELIKKSETKELTANNDKSLYQYQIEIESLQYLIDEAQKIEKRRTDAIRRKDTKAEQEALKELQTLLGGSGYKTIDQTKQALMKLKGERNSLRTYQMGTGQFSEDITAVVNPNTVYYNESAEDYIKDGEQTAQYKKYISSDKYKYLEDAEKKTLAYYIGKDKRQAEKKPKNSWMIYMN